MSNRDQAPGDFNLPRRKHLILFLGAKWWGSDSRALAAALRSLGHTLVEVDYEDYVPVRWASFPLRVARRLLKPWCARDYNRAILQHSANRAIDFMLVFKGKHLAAETLERFVQSGRAAYCIYPDVSFVDHGPEIWKCLPLYNSVFTTKSFHLDDPSVRRRVRGLHLVRHGFDPEVHRPVEPDGRAAAAYTCDASFVGCWSPKKQRLLDSLAHDHPGLDLRVWGTGWERGGQKVAAYWQGRGAFGDELAIIHGSSKINLGLLSEAGGGSTVGDQVTARTWQIPASGGFMLHESTRELEQYFTPGREIGVFASPSELASKTAYYLSHEAERIAIAAKGHARCLAEGYTYIRAAGQILAFHESVFSASGK